MKKEIRLLIAEEHSLVRKGYLSLFKKYKNFYVIGDAENGKQLIEKYFELKPDIIISGISLPDMSGLDAIREISQKDASVKAIILTMHTDENYIYMAHKIGIKGFVSKTVLPVELKRVIRKVDRGGSQFLDYQSVDLKQLILKYDLINGNKLELIKHLTKRQMAILSLVSKKYSSEEIAVLLDLSIRTVESHRYKIIKKLKIKNQLQLANFTLELNKTN